MSQLFRVLHGLKCPRRERHSGFDGGTSKWLLSVHTAELQRRKTKFSLVLICVLGVQPYPAHAPIKKLPWICVGTADNMGPT